MDKNGCNILDVLEQLHIKELPSLNLLELNSAVQLNLLEIDESQLTAEQANVVETLENHAKLMDEEICNRWAVLVEDKTLLGCSGDSLSLWLFGLGMEKLLYLSEIWREKEFKDENYFRLRVLVYDEILARCEETETCIS